MADRIIKPDDTNDLVLQNNHGNAKIEVNEDDTVVVYSIGNFSVDSTGDIILDADGADVTLKDGGTTFGTLKQVSGDLVIQPTSSKQIILNEDGGAAALTIDTDGNTEIAQNIEQADAKNIQTDEVRARDGDGLKLYDDDGNGIFVEDGGNIGIGIANPAVLLHLKGSAPKFSIDGPSGNNAIQMGTVSADDPFYGVIFTLKKNDGTVEVQLGSGAGFGYNYINSANFGLGDSTPSYQLELSTDSAAKPSTTTWTNPSDARLKEDIENADLDICYNVVKTLPLKRYKWRNDIYSTEKVRDRHKIGWIAQDVESVFPKAVNQYDFKFNQVFELDEDGIEQIVSEDVIEDCRALNADQIYAVMFGAIQKLQTKVEALENA